MVNIVWGLRPRDMSGCHFSDENCQGIQQYDDTFNPNTVAAQVALMVRNQRFALLSLSTSLSRLHEIIPAGVWCQNDVVSTSMRHHVASTLIRRHFDVMCTLPARTMFYCIMCLGSVL